MAGPPLELNCWDKLLLIVISLSETLQKCWRKHQQHCQHIEEEHQNELKKSYQVEGEEEEGKSFFIVCTNQTQVNLEGNDADRNHL